MIKLYSFGRAFNMIDPSPFILKIDAYLRMANIPYETIPDVNNLRKAPKGKLPFITDGDKTIGDSQFIIAYLQDKFQVELDSSLSPEQQGLAYLMGKALDEDLYWCLVYSRWAKDDTWPLVKKALFGSMPFPLKVIVPFVARKGVLGALQKQGLGRHSEEEIYTIADKSFHALSEVLADKTYFFNNSPCTFDATAFGFLDQFINVEIDCKMNDLAKNYSNLVDYCNNIRAKYY
ncbi:MAG: glutathione S-transferase family protein [Methylococcales bacterium]|nr:glutathione S-transferase family protein [Methylococcales bacterium]